MLTVEGPAGIGKTRLLEEAHSLATELGFDVLQATGDELESAIAWSIIRQMLERSVSRLRGDDRERMLSGPVGDALGALDAAPTDAPAGDAAVARTLHTLWWVIADLATEGPLLITVDDAQWADLPSLRFLLYLSRRIVDVPVVLLVALRPVTARSGVLAELSAGRGAGRIVPEPLSAEAIALLGARFGVPPAPAVTAAIHAASGGNPFLAELLLDELRSRGVQLEDPAVASVVGSVGPSTIARAVLTRLPPNATALAGAAAVLGARSEPWLAGAIVGLEGARLGSAIDALVVAHVASISRDRLEFVHPVVREAVLAELGPGERAGLHADTAAALREAGASAPRVAAHVALGPVGALPDAVPILRAAAAALLSSGDAITGAAHLQRAVEESPLDLDLQGELGFALLRAGNPAAAKEHLLASAAGATDPMQRALRTAGAATATATLDGPGAAMTGLLDALDGWPGSSISPPRLVLEARLATISFHLHGEGRQSIQHLRAFADLPGTTPQERTVLALLAQLERYDVRPAADVVAIAAHALADGAYLADIAGGSDEMSGWFVAMMSLVAADEISLAVAELERARARIRHRGSPLEFAMISNLAGWLAWRTGDLETAETETDAALAAVGAESPSPELTAVQAMAAHVTVLAALERGATVVAVSALERFDASGNGAGPPVIPATWLGEARVRLLLEQGEVERAYDEALKLGERMRAAQLDVPTIPWRNAAAIAASRLERHEEAGTLAADQLELARRWTAASDVGAALRLSGRVETDPELRSTRLEEAVAVLEGSPARLELARALVDLGEALRVTQHRSRAREVLRRGADLAGECRAVVIRERAMAGLAALGDRPRTAAFAGEDSLTAGERRIAQLAMVGRTNRDIAQELFITPKTVENHLGRVYSKLAIGGRRELAAALRRPTPKS